VHRRPAAGLGAGIQEVHRHLGQGRDAAVEEADVDRCPFAGALPVVEGGQHAVGAVDGTQGICERNGHRGRPPVRRRVHHVDPAERLGNQVLPGPVRIRAVCPYPVAEA